MASFDYLDEEQGGTTVVHVISDSVGDTAYGVVQAAAGQFAESAIEIHRLPQLRTVSQVREYFDSPEHPEENTAVFHTVVDYNLRLELKQELDRRGIPSIDLLGPAMSILSTLTGDEPKNIPGIIRANDARYNRRVDGMDFFAEHDDGRKTDDLPEADAVLFGVSRTSKTPLSMYLAFLGYKVANITYVHGREVPKELFECNPRRVFGMVKPATVLETEAERAISDAAALSLAGSYADPTEADVEQAEAREIMDRIDCTIIEVDGRTIEDLASVILERLMEFTSTKL